MPVFQVRQEGSNAIVWTGSATGQDQALDAMAHAAGYRGRTDLPQTITGGGLSVEALTFDASPSTARATGGRSGQPTGTTKQTKQFG